MTSRKVSKTALALNSSYTHTPLQTGRGPKIDKARALLGSFSSANQYAKNHKIATNTKKFTDAVGLTDFIDNKTGGYYSKGAKLATSHGYGRRKRRSKK